MNNLLGIINIEAFDNLREGEEEEDGQDKEMTENIGVPKDKKYNRESAYSNLQLCFNYDVFSHCLLCRYEISYIDKLCLDKVIIYFYMILCCFIC